MPSRHRARRCAGLTVSQLVSLAACWLCVTAIASLAGTDARAQSSTTAQRNNTAPGRPLLEVDNWGYQLHSLDTNVIASNNDYDLLVVDYSRGGSEGERLTRADIAKMKTRPNGRPRVILCYISIGEAENYRYYWQSGWRMGTPNWLLWENKQWKGNFIIKFWDAEWKNIIYGGDKSYLSRIIDAGFDGIYLDRVDVHNEVTKYNPDARRDMIAFVAEMAKVARQRKPGFFIVPQNAEELVTDEGYMKVIDALGIEDLLYGANSEGQRNSASEIRDRSELLKMARRAGKGVFIVEYLNKPADIERARNEIMTMEAGFIPYVVAPRDLGRIKTENLETHDEPE